MYFSSFRFRLLPIMEWNIVLIPWFSTSDGWSCVDALIAQRSESGGFCGTLSALSLIPQVVDVVEDYLPVVAAVELQMGVDW